MNGKLLAAQVINRHAEGRIADAVREQTDLLTKEVSELKGKINELNTSLSLANEHNNELARISTEGADKQNEYIRELKNEIDEANKKIAELEKTPIPAPNDERSVATEVKSEKGKTTAKTQKSK